MFIIASFFFIFVLLSFVVFESKDCVCSFIFVDFVFDTNFKGKTAISSTKTVSKTINKTVKRRAEKKVYSLPGQKYDPPEEREPLRIFYESLSGQIPSSEMAEIWMMEHGLLSPERAKKAYERKQRRQQQQRLGTPIKSNKQERPESSKKPQVSKNGDVKAKKRVNYSDDDDDDFIVKSKRAK
ncbi:hypothetical protein BHE74_00001785 [Ensete ventricosum]|nr:hypothetical protein BHE74_00001785 [Ensete ventricosum]